MTFIFPPLAAQFMLCRHTCPQAILVACGLLPSLLLAATSCWAVSPGSKVSSAPGPRPSTLPEPSLAFVQSNCLDCHDGDSGEGGFDANVLKAELTKPDELRNWVRVYDRVRKGEMPPPEDATLDSSELKGFLPATEQALQLAARAMRVQNGRVQGRRLTNAQLENTLNNLLCIQSPLAKRMPAEQRTHGFVHLAEAQTMSHFQLESHLRVVDAALDASFSRAMEGNQKWTIDLAPEKIANKTGDQRNRYPEMRQGLAVTWSHGLLFYGRIKRTEVRESGWYEIEVTASAIKKPKEHGVWCSVRSGECTSGAPLMTWIGDFEADDQPKTMKYRAWIPKNHMLEIRPADVTLKKARTEGGQVGIGECEEQDVPGVGLHRLKLTRVYPGGDVSTVRKRLFGGLSVKWDAKAKRSFPVLDDVNDTEAEKLLLRQLMQFGQYAFRRPTRPEDVQPFADFAIETFQRHRTDPALKLPRGQAYYEAIRSGFRALLCSPRFLYLAEPVSQSGELDQWAVASRLSYFLCNTMPDKTLLVAAKRGLLENPAELRRQTTRLLETPVGEDFVRNFAAHWLDLIDIGFTEPDRRLFKDFDVCVQDAMLEETHLFLDKLLTEDRPVHEMIDADYTFMDSRLARYYDIETAMKNPDSASELDDEMRLIRLKPKANRGGLLAHGSILKVTANGNDTSPVLRGIWVCERILGMEIPAPPANVPAVEPDIRGATTIRELLAKHESEASCAACHKSFDPPGFALENFDAGGKWRNQYRQLIQGKFKRSGRVDPSHTMLSGDHFDSFMQFRALLAKDEKALARNLASQMLVFATGANVGFSDRPTLDMIVSQTSKQGHGFRSILDAVIASESFLKK